MEQPTAGEGRPPRRYCPPARRPRSEGRFRHFPLEAVQQPIQPIGIAGRYNHCVLDTWLVRSASTVHRAHRQVSEFWRGCSRCGAPSSWRILSTPNSIPGGKEVKKCFRLFPIGHDRFRNRACALEIALLFSSSVFPFSPSVLDLPGTNRLRAIHFGTFLPAKTRRRVRRFPFVSANPR